MVGNLEDDSFPFEMVPFWGNIRSFSGGGGTVIGIHNELPTPGTDHLGAGPFIKNLSFISGSIFETKHQLIH